jgi:hypothetical protein
MTPLPNWAMLVSLDTKPKDDISPILRNSLPCILSFIIMFLQQLDLDGIFPQQIIDVFGITLSPQKLIFLLGQLAIRVLLLAPSESLR